MIRSQFSRLKVWFSLWLIKTFSHDTDDFIVRKTKAAINVMKKNNLFKEEEEYTYEVLNCFEKYGLGLQILSQYLKRPQLDVYSVITRKEWTEVFPKIVLSLDNKIIKDGR